MGLFDGLKKKDKKVEEQKLDQTINEEIKIEDNIEATKEVQDTPKKSSVLDGSIKEDDFAYVIDDTFPLKDGGIVTVGRLLVGKVKVSDKVYYSDKSGRVMALCTIGGIEQAKTILEEASADAKGVFGAHYAFMMPELTMELVEKGNLLVSDSMLQGDRIKELDTTPPAQKQNDSISKERKSEIGPIVFEKEITKERLVNLSIQEVIFLINSIKVFQQKSPLENYEENVKVLCNDVIDKLKAADKLYVTFDKSTGYPFLNQGFVDVYSTEEYAKEAVDFYAQQYRQLEVKEIEKTKGLTKANINLFAFLYFLGMERIMVDNGKYKIAVNRSELLPPPDFSNVPKASVPVLNPNLHLALLDFFGELRWRVQYPKRQEVMKQKENRMIEEICKAKYLVPMKHEGKTERKDDNSIVFKEEGKLLFAKITNTNNDSYIPVFSDWMEFEKVYDKKEWNGAIISILDAIRIGNGDGVTINPYGENLILNENNMNQVKKECERLGITK